jgi:hypothetical protein
LKAAWADGPPYIRWYALERAKTTLAALDPAKVEKIPYEDEIRALVEELKAKKDKPLE